MRSNRWFALALLTGGVFSIAEAVTPISSNPADSPVRVKSGKVFASTESELPPAIGPRFAKVLVIVLDDFQCPVCRRSADATEQIAEEFPGDVRVEFWQHPLASHPDAENAAVASLAAHRQGKFWEYHDELYRNQSAISPANLALYAERVGLERARFESDYAAPELRAGVKREAAAAERLGARNTPAFMVNGRLKVGWGSWLAFRGDVERELVEARKLEEGGTPPDRISEKRAETLIEDAEVLRAYRELVLNPAPNAPSAKSTEKVVAGTPSPR
jgi:protein-disulfide isomerase